MNKYELYILKERTKVSAYLSLADLHDVYIHISQACKGVSEVPFITTSTSILFIDTRYYQIQHFLPCSDFFSNKLYLKIIELQLI